MAIVPRNFSEADWATVRSGLGIISTLLQHPPGPMPGDLRAKLQDILSDQRRPTVKLVYGGGKEVCRGHYARSAGYRILLCDKTLRPEPDTGRPRLSAILFHELIHIARGEELDSEAFENAWFTYEEGARQPTLDDWSVFKEDHYEGWWVRLDFHTREVTDYADRPIITFDDPLVLGAAPLRTSPHPIHNEGGSHGEPAESEN